MLHVPEQGIQNAFLPVCAQDMHVRGWDSLDFVFVIGDAYVDHPSFAPAVISRNLEAAGYKVGIIAQPDWNKPESIAVLGEPRLGFLVCSGNMDSMVNHYTVARKRRNTDSYSPGGKAGLRPNHAAVVYCNLIRRVYKKTPVIVGGIEASLRRFAHYDYWSDSVKRSLLLDAGANLLVYGMGERSIVEIADALASGLAIEDITFIQGTSYKAKSLEQVYDYELLPSWESIRSSKLAFAQSFAIQYKNSDPVVGKRLVEPYSDHEFVVQNPPQMPLSREELDASYGLAYTRMWHPMYDEAGGVPALAEVKYSITSSRGCFGECAFCALTFHQGRIVSSRSHESIIEEAQAFTEDPDFKGYIHDIGGPTANFRKPACPKQLKQGACAHRRCLTPKPCPSLTKDHSDYLELLRKVRSLPGIKKVFVRSGIRFDYVMTDPKHAQFMKELVEHHVSGQLKVAPEHVNKQTLMTMGKPANEVFQAFAAEYAAENAAAGKNQFMVPYFMSSHPGCTLEAAVELAEYVRDMGYNPEQVQDFYPTPASLATCMYYTGLNPLTMEEVYVPKDPHEKAMQRALIQYRNPKNRALVEEALHKAGRDDLIGYGEKCLIRPQHKHSLARNRTGGRQQEAQARTRAGGQRQTRAHARSAGRNQAQVHAHPNNHHQRRP